MLNAFLHALSAIFVILSVVAVGVWTARKGWYDDRSRTVIAKLVSFTIPFFLFHSVTSKFTHDELFALLRVAGLPFVTVGINFLISVILVRIGVVRKGLEGAFIACFTSSTTLFVGAPLTLAMFGEKGIPYLLVYFFANVVFIWTIGQFNIQMDGVRRNGGVKPSLISGKSLKMLFSPPLVGFLIGLVWVVGSLPLPDALRMSTRYIGQIATPLALVFVGITVYKVGFSKFKNMPLELWLILFSCYVLRPVVMYFCSLPLEMDALMRQVFVVSSALPVSSVMAVLSRTYGADDEFASSAVGVSTVALIFVLPVLLTAVSLIG